MRLAILLLIAGGLQAACQSRKGGDAQSPFNGSIVLSECKGFVMSDPFVAVATVETDAENNRVFRATFADRSSTLSPPSQLQIMIVGDVRAGAQNLPAADCKSGKGIVGACATYLENGTSVQLVGGFIRVDKLPVANGQDFALDFELSHGRERQLQGSASGKTEALPSVPSAPAN